MNSGAGVGNLLVLALPLLLLAFLMFSQRKRGRQIQEFQSALSVGDKVVLTSGLYGTITALDDVVATLEIAPGVQVRVDRRAVGLTQPGATATDATGTVSPGSDTTPEGN
ncbi:preprotein translocase subunit YajC [Knoellia subterranea]|uniref:Protein-export membrane protein YajC n=1 Tax=Knoellia subterranea KCTC 19937 TaxID=1385521 RepID=A0A0A0JPD3_9MICO|nr:preprotein translocase subunit YajC [Knoellia subterranea]KGN38609.1 protein-export membrane protein YajC [Knoellia subterranea KCTC 19937]